MVSGQYLRVLGQGAGAQAQDQGDCLPESGDEADHDRGRAKDRRNGPVMERAPS